MDKIIKLEKEQKKAMKLVDLENAIVNTLVHYDTKYLDALDPDSIYSYNCKDECIAEFKREIEKLKEEHPAGLYAKESVCMFCYPGFNAFSFYSKASDEYIIRYVIAEDKDMYRVEPCNNKPIPDGEDGMPF